MPWSATRSAAAHKIGDYALKLAAGKAMKVGVIEGQPGYHSTERVGGFLDAIKGSDFDVVASLDGKWNVDGGNTAAMDMLQAHPEIQLVFAANDYMIMGAALAAKALGHEGLVLLGNDGDTACLEEIAAGNVTATVNTSPFIMGQVALQVTLDVLDNKFPAGSRRRPRSSTRATCCRSWRSPTSSTRSRPRATEGARPGARPPGGRENPCPVPAKSSGS